MKRFKVVVRSIWLYSVVVEGKNRREATEKALTTDIEDFDNIEKNIEWKIHSIKELF